MNEKNGFVYVVTPSLGGVVQPNSKVNFEGCEPMFYEDFINGRRVAPLVSIFAKKLNVVK